MSYFQTTLFKATVNSNKVMGTAKEKRIADGMPKKSGGEYYLIRPSKRLATCSVDFSICLVNKTVKHPGSGLVILLISVWSLRWWCKLVAGALSVRG